jgi:hypothetical protein
MFNPEHTEKPLDWGFASQEGETDPSNKPAEISIKESVGKVLDQLRLDFSELVGKVKALPKGHHNRLLYARQAVSINVRIRDAEAILDLRNWPAGQVGKKRNGRPPKVKE